MELAVTIHILDILVSGIFDVVLIYILAKVKFQKKHLILLLPLLLFCTFLSVCGNLAGLIANIFEIVILYIYFRNRTTSRVLILDAIFISYAIGILTGSIKNAISDVVSIIAEESISFLISLVIYVITLFLIKTYRDQLTNMFTSRKTGKSFLYLFSYLYISAFLLNLATIYKRWLYSPAFTLTVVILIQVAFAVIIFWVDLHIQQGLLDQQEQELREKYLQDLEDSEDRVRKFKHDYMNMLSSLRETARNNQDQELLQELEKYSDSQINDPNLWKYKNLNHIHNQVLKSLIISKLDLMRDKGIKYSLECAQEINALPQSVKTFDLVRVIGIALDNAIEESEFLLAQSGDAEIDIMFYQVQGESFEFEVKNKYFPRNIDINEIKKRGMTTKKGHKGYGLANVHEIKDKYENMFIEYGAVDDWFTFSLVIEWDEE